ncbi:MAG: aldehyde-activating protein [Sphingomonas sp.]|nr:aldehyde-activating protein [Sphingomonas sp.]
MAETVTGGCQCGRIRYSARIEVRQAYLCHCRMCQRATGGVAAAFFGVEKASVSWSNAPDFFASSAIAERPFCATCGTPLGFAYPDASKMDLTVGSLDGPAGFVPISHFGAETINEAWLDTSALPRDRCDSYPPLVARWERVKER